MAERRQDHRRLFRYPVEAPFQNRRNHPTRVTPGSWVRTWGIDGRFLGAARTFPGFKKVLDIKGAPFNNSSSDYWKDLSTQDPETDPYYWTVPINNNEEDGVTEIWFCKFLSVQVPEFESVKGSSTTHGGRVLRGWAIAHPQPDNDNRGVFRFYFYDPVLERWAYHDLLKEVEDLDEIKADRSTPASSDPEWPFVTFYTDQSGLVASTSSYEVASQGNFIYFSILRQPEGTGENVINSWHRSIRVQGIGLTTDCTTNVFYLNSHSLWIPSHIGPLDLRLDDELSETVEGAQNYPENYGPPIYNLGRTEDASTVITQKIKCGIITFCTSKNVKSPIQQIGETSVNEKKIVWDTDWTFYEDSGSDVFYRRRLPWYYLGIKLRPYRTMDTQLFSDTNGQSFILGGTMFREESEEIWEDGDIVDNTDYSAATSVGDPEAGDVEDEVVVAQPALDPYSDDTAFAPKKIRLILPYQATMLRIGSVPQTPQPDTINDRDDILSWGALDKFAPEQFRVVDSTPLGASLDEYALSLIAAGDYAFVVGDTSIFRIHRAGNRIAINEIQTLAGGVSRFAAVGVGTTLFYVSPTGLFAVEGASGEFQLVSALDRIIQNDWRASLSSLHLVYDNNLGAVALLNTTEKEMILLWNNTGAITGLRDIPFKFGTQGIDPVYQDHNRSWWITDAGIVYTINSERSSVSYGTDTQGAKSLCGGDPDKIWNISLPADLHTVTKVRIPVSSVGEFDLSAEEFSVYFLDGDNAGESRVIQSIDSLNSDFTYTTTSITDVSGSADAFANVAVGDLIVFILDGTEYTREVDTQSDSEITWVGAIASTPDEDTDTFEVFESRTADASDTWTDIFDEGSPNTGGHVALTSWDGNDGVVTPLYSDLIDDVTAGDILQITENDGLRLVINVSPSNLTSAYKLRFYVSSLVAAGDAQLLAYVSSSIVTTDNMIEKTVSGTGWQEIELTEALIGEMQTSLVTLRLVGDNGTVDFYISEAELVRTKYWGTTTTLSEDTNLEGTDYTDSYGVGDWIKFTSGANDGELRKITSVTEGSQGEEMVFGWDDALPSAYSQGDTFQLIDNSGGKVEGNGGVELSQITLETALDNVPAEDDRISIAPVYYEMVGWPLQDEQEGVPDPIQVKKIKAISHHVNLIAGETDPDTNPNLKMDHLIYSRSDLGYGEDIGTPLSKTIYEDQTKNFTHRPNSTKGTILYPSWRCLSSNLDFELIEGFVRGTLEQSESETKPVK